MTTPILFLIFNRPDATRRSFEVIRSAKPTKLYIAADGPRRDRIGELDLCLETREVVGSIDWACHVYTLFREDNLGCGRAVSSAIDWFFSQEEEGIIIEDDVLPNKDFFAFCATLLDYYRNNPDVAFISGKSYLEPRDDIKSSYYFSTFNHVWGWATWARVWREYSFTLENIKYDHFVKDLNLLFEDESHIRYWKWIYWVMKYKQINTWDYQLTLLLMSRRFLSIIPRVNLVENIGFGDSGTHTRENSYMDKSNISYELGTIVHPPQLLRDEDADLRETILEGRTIGRYSYCIARLKLMIKSYLYGKGIIR